MMIGRSQAASSLPEPALDAELLELHVFREELLLDIPVPAIRFQIKFRTPQKIDRETAKVEMQFHGALKTMLGDGAEAYTFEGEEEHFGWMVYSFGYTVGGDTLSESVIDSIAKDPHKYITARVVWQEERV